VIETDTSVSASFSIFIFLILLRIGAANQKALMAVTHEFFKELS